jgi:hypothetical protein
LANEIVKFEDLPSIKRGYIEGLKYYYSIIQRNEQSFVEFPELYSSIVQFGYELARINQDEEGSSLGALVMLNNDFYPEGKMHPAFRALKLEVALDGISECLMYLKKRVYV